ncbi:MAG: DUF6476 family protein [Roseinatronobacter sp.]
MTPDLRLLRRLVVVLTSVMILGLILILGLLVTRLGLAPAPLAVPDHISLPEGRSMAALTLSDRWVIVVTGQQEVLFFDRRSGDLVHVLPIPTP